jgi:uncharacterized membrane protein YsdA (DUF1294 family)
MPRKGRSRRGAPPIVFYVLAAACGGGLFYVVRNMVDWKPYLAWLVSWSIVTFLFYGWDKSQAVRGAWRVPEMVLHGLALVGGVAGGWAGMFIFHHKTQKVEFKLVLVFATILHAMLINALLVA